MLAAPAVSLFASSSKHGIHRASSSSWGDESVARLCSIIVDSNNGMAQQIMENRHDLLDIYSLDELKETDDLGLTLPFLAVYYDRPDMLKYLHQRGFDLSTTCDAMKFGACVCRVPVLFYPVILSL